MKLRKMIPGVVAVLLAVILSVGLFVNGVPEAMADEVTGMTDWILSESGYVRGEDRTIYPYTCSMFFAERTWTYLSTDEERQDPIYVNGVGVLLEVDNRASIMGRSVSEPACVVEAWAYIPELDTYAKLTGVEVYQSNDHAWVISTSVPCCVEEREQMYEGELISVTARFYLMGREVETLSWSAES